MPGVGRHSFRHSHTSLSSRTLPDLNGDRHHVDRDLTREPSLTSADSVHRRRGLADFAAMRVQVARPAEHAGIAELPLDERLDDWTLPNVHRVIGLHRHVVKLVELAGVSYVVKELPDHLADREYRLLRAIAECGLPTAEMVAVVTRTRPSARGSSSPATSTTRCPYRTLLMGRGLKIPYLGDRLLDALVVLLARIHLAGFFWGDCSLSNTLFRRDAGALQAYIIDVETAEHHDELTRRPARARPHDRDRQRRRRPARPAGRGSSGAGASTRSRWRWRSRTATRRCGPSSPPR